MTESPCTYTIQRHSNGHSNFSLAGPVSFSLARPRASQRALTVLHLARSAPHTGVSVLRGSRGLRSSRRQAGAALCRWYATLSSFPFARRARPGRTRTRGNRKETESNGRTVLLPPLLYSRSSHRAFCRLPEGTTPIGAGGQHFCP